MTIETFEKPLTIIPFRAQYQPDFYRLNAAWIAPNFGLEAEDIQFLQNPEVEIIAQGGMVFFALVENTVVGTCGLYKMDESTFELVRMAVDLDYRGLKVGKQLLAYAIEWARSRQASQVILESSTQPVNRVAVQMYEKMGFQHYIAKPEHRSALARADVFMHLPLH